MEDKEEIGNPYGAGRYGYIRSSEDCDALISGRNARFELSCNRWIEHIWCGYASWRDGKADQEWDDLFRDEFRQKHPLINYKEVFYELEYGDTRDQVPYAWFLLEECEGNKNRWFNFGVNNVSMQDFEEYIAALERWHMTGELNIGPYNVSLSFSPWREI